MKPNLLSAAKPQGAAYHRGLDVRWLWSLIFCKENCYTDYKQFCFLWFLFPC